MQRASALLFLLLMFTGVAHAQDRTPIVVWHAYRGQELNALTHVARAFEREHPSVQIQLLAQPFGAYASKLQSAIPTGNGPDLFIDAHDRVASFAAAGILDEFLPSDPARVARRLEASDALSVDGVRYGLPLSLKCAALYLNVAYAPSEIRSLEQLEEIAPNLPDGVFALAMESESSYWTSSLFAAYGVSLVTDDGAWGLTGDPAERALTQLAGLVESGVIPEEANGDLVKRLFADGRAMSAISGPWLAGDLPASLEWRVAPLPVVEAADGEQMRPLVTVEGVYLADGVEHRELAIQFAEYLAFDGALTRANEGRQVVTDRDAWAELEGDAFLASFRDAARQGVITSTHPHMNLAYVPADRAIRKVLRGSATPHDALIEGAHRFDDVTRPPPPPIDSFWGVLVLSILGLLGFVWLVARLRDPAFRLAVSRSVPAYRYVAHAFVAIGLLVVLPLAVGGATSFFAGRGTDMHFVGFANYLDILSSRGGDAFGHGSFWLVLLVTILWTALNIALHLCIGVALALLLHRPYLKLKGIYRVLLILPWAVPNYVTALAWKGMFHRQFGAVNAILDTIGVEPVSWFSEWSTAFAANLTTNVWLGFPFMMVVTLGALTAIPKDVYEAAAVDGANAWQRFTKITVPLLGPYMLPAIAMGAVWTFNMFNVVFLVSGGEPDGGTEILVSEAYRWAFTRGNQYGYAAAYAVLIFGILALSTRLAAGARRGSRT